jgi:uncharacterized membrane protein
MGENHFSKWPVICYGIVLIMNAIAYTILAKTLVSHHGKDSLIAKALGKDWKGKLSLAIYAIAIGTSFIHSGIGLTLYFVVAAIWLIPDRRIEKLLNSVASHEK